MVFITGRAEDKRSKFTGEGNCDSKAETQFEQQRRRSEGEQHIGEMSVHINWS